MPGAPANELEGPALERAVRRNTILLGAAMAVTSASLQLGAAIATLTFVLVAGIEGLLGLGPAILLVTGALAAVPAGRAMDRFGRVPVIATGFAAGAAGGLLTGVGSRVVSPVLVIVGFLLIGAANGTVLLSRAAAGDMYPPERRARGIALVLFGSVFGAILGPVVFGPLFAGKELEPEALMIPWFAAAAFMLAGLLLVLFIRPDPRSIGHVIAAPAATGPPGSAASLGEILRRPGVVPALLAAFASFGVMVGVMNLTGYAVVNEHGHHQSDVFPIIGAHVFGMYALVLVVGNLIDRLGRTPALVGGLVVMGSSCLFLTWTASVAATALLLFGLGVGWNLSFVAATAELVDRASVVERGKLLGFNDLGSSVLGAALALLGGYALQALGVVALAVGATAIAVVPALYIARRRVARVAPAASVGGERA